MYIHKFAITVIIIIEFVILKSNGKYKIPFSSLFNSNECNEKRFTIDHSHVSQYISG